MFAVIVLVGALAITTKAADLSLIEDRLARAEISSREGSCGVVLPSRDALVFGGVGAFGPSPAVDVLAPDGSHRFAMSMPFPRSGHACAVLVDGRILVAGGATPEAAVYDPARDQWTATNAMALPRSGHTATLLDDGRVLIAGGENAAGATASLEVFDPSRMAFDLLPFQLTLARRGHAAAMVGRGHLLVAGGSDGTTDLASTEIIDIHTGARSSGPELSEPRADLRAHRFPDGKVLVRSSREPGVATKADLIDPATRSAAAVRTIAFSGRDWWVKDGAGSKVGPGPNLFSASASNVWVDSAGRLHLKLRRTSAGWTCAEVVLFDSLGFGSYRWVIDSPVSDFDPQIVLGLFTWNGSDPAYYNREIDVEFSKWGDSRAGTNAEFTVQPSSTAGNVSRFAVPSGLRQTVHEFRWQDTSIAATSLNGTQTLASHTFTDGIPQAGGENARINLWLFRGRSPKQGAEVVVNRFEFVR